MLNIKKIKNKLKKLNKIKLLRLNLYRIRNLKKNL